MAKAALAFSLPEAGRQALDSLLHKGVHSSRKLNRARILLKLDQGLGPAQVAREVGVCEATVYQVRKRAIEEEWSSALSERPRSGAPQKISAKARAQITALACSKPPSGHSRWTLRLLSDRVIELGFVERISHQWVKEILKKTH